MPGEVVISKNAVRSELGSGYLSISEAGIELMVRHVGIADDELGWLFACLREEPETGGWISPADVCKSMKVPQPATQTHASMPWQGP